MKFMTAFHAGKIEKKTGKGKKKEAIMLRI